MTQDTVAKLSDSELVQVIAWAQEEQKARTEKHKRDTIAKIRELARSIEVGIKIEGTRGRPSKRGNNQPPVIDSRPTRLSGSSPHSI